MTSVNEPLQGTKRPSSGWQISYVVSRLATKPSATSINEPLRGTKRPSSGLKMSYVISRLARKLCGTYVNEPLELLSKLLTLRSKK